MICSVCHNEVDRSLIRHLHRDMSQPHICSPCARRTLRWGALQHMYLTREEAIHIKDINHYCTEEFAIENNYAKCPICGKWFTNNTTFIQSNALNVMVCPGCNSCFSNPTHMSYYHASHEVPPVFYPERTIDADSIIESRQENVHMGFELELGMRRGSGNRDNIIQEVFSNNTGMLFHTESDCSITGFETISSPATMHYYNSIKPQLTDMYANLMSHGMTASSACGCHVHMDRAYFGDTPNYVEKLHLLVYKFKSYLTRVSHRNANSINDWAQIADVEVASNNAIRISGRNGRYSAVNSCNSNTIEMRLWGCARNIDELYNFLAHTYALAYIAKNYSIEQINNLSLNEFKNIAEEAKNI